MYRGPTVAYTETVEKDLSRLNQVELGGVDYLNAVTSLLQTARNRSPDGGVWEAADLQWWWRRDQHEDPRGQIFWVDAENPVAAVVLTNWGSRWQCDLICTEEETSQSASLLWNRAAQQIEALDANPLEVVVRADDQALLDVLISQAGFTVGGEPGVNSWMSACERPPIPPLQPGFKLVARSDVLDTLHHMSPRSGANIADRLAECSLYDAKLDLAIYTTSGELAAYALFWVDPITGVGLVEPMRTEEKYQRRGLALHLLATGLDRMANAGSSRFKVGSDHDLYLRAGFHPTTTVLSLTPTS